MMELSELEDAIFRPADFLDRGRDEPRWSWQFRAACEALAVVLKCECPECGYTVRTTQKWIDIAFPICGNVSEHEDGEFVEMPLAES